jgi:hypothetical protein
MANIYRKVNTDLITATEQDVYTVPNNARSLIKSIHIYNGGAGPAIVTIKIASGGVDYFYDKQTIAADVKHEFIVNILILEEDDILKMLSDITGPDITVSILETSREDK